MSEVGRRSRTDLTSRREQAAVAGGHEDRIAGVACVPGLGAGDAECRVEQIVGETTSERFGRDGRVEPNLEHFSGTKGPGSAASYSSRPAQMQRCAAERTREAAITGAIYGYALRLGLAVPLHAQARLAMADEANLSRRQRVGKCVERQHGRRY